MTDVSSAFERARSRFDKNAASGFSVIYQLSISDGGEYYLIIDNGQPSINEGFSPSADLTLDLDTETMLAVLSGSLDGIQAFLFGRVRVTGSVNLASKLLDFFSLKNNL